MQQDLIAVQGQKPDFLFRPDLVDLQFVSFFDQIDNHNVGFGWKNEVPTPGKGGFIYSSRDVVSLINIEKTDTQ